MPSCREWIMSEDYAEEIVGYYGQRDLLSDAACYQLVNEDFAIVYRPVREVGNQPGQRVSFSVPYCYGLLQQDILEESGVSRVRRVPGFDYFGQGILIGFVDTGIDYTHPVFLRADGTSRVETIWDQEDQRGTPPDGLEFGTLFTEEEIAAGAAPKDENGHGTFLAGVAAGKEDREAEFTGVASLATIVMVKLKQAKVPLKQYFGIREEISAYSEADVMLGVRFLIEYAARVRKPLVLCIGIGNSLGSHEGTTPLSLYLNSLAYRPNVCIIAAAGNEGNTRHHALVELSGRQKEAEVYVEGRTAGFTLELFTEAIAELALTIISPAGEASPVLNNSFTENVRIPYLFDRSVVYAERESLMRVGTLQSLRLRFRTPAEGIWRLVFSETAMTAQVRLWLPLQEFLEERVYFLASAPEVTLCEPANAPLLLTVGGYSAENGSLAPFSGRGFTADGQNQPTLLAPSVNMQGPFAGGGFITKSGTSIGAAYTAGCVALFMEYIEEYRRMNASVPVDTVLLKNLFSIGAMREEEMEYPSPAYGFGKLNLYGVFEFLRNL